MCDGRARAQKDTHPEAGQQEGAGGDAQGHVLTLRARRAALAAAIAPTRERKNDS